MFKKFDAAEYDDQAAECDKFLRKLHARDQQSEPLVYKTYEQQQPTVADIGQQWRDYIEQRLTDAVQVAHDAATSMHNELVTATEDEFQACIDQFESLEEKINAILTRLQVLEAVARREVSQLPKAKGDAAA